MTTKIKKVTEIKFWVKIVVEKDDPGFHAYAPSLKGLHMGGDSPQEALLNAKEAAALYLKSMLKHGDVIPIDLLEKDTAQKTLPEK
jgi:predicted RNase H-like HicB family nuclease